MKQRGLVSATVTFMRKDNRAEEKSNRRIEADDSVGLEKDGEFETRPLPEGWYTWSLVAFKPDNPRRIGFRGGDHFLEGEVYIPADEQPKELIIKIRGEYKPELIDKQDELLEKPTSDELQGAINKLKAQMRNDKKASYAALVTSERIRMSVIGNIESYQAQMAANENFDANPSYFLNTIKPLLLRIAGGEWPDGCKFEAWYPNDNGRGINTDGLTIRLELSTPSAAHPAFALNLIELNIGKF